MDIYPPPPSPSDVSPPVMIPLKTAYEVVQAQGL